ncbi:MAG TPA: hypothetical protein VL242_43485 [Sorangium sp.]|nr:hypothetical protein [Sorangium sp.]
MATATVAATAARGAAATRSASRIAYLDEDLLTALGVTFTLGPPGKRDTSWDDQGKMIPGEDRGHLLTPLLC